MAKLSANTSNPLARWYDTLVSSARQAPRDRFVLNNILPNLVSYLPTTTELGTYADLTGANGLDRQLTSAAVPALRGWNMGRDVGNYLQSGQLGSSIVDAVQSASKDPAYAMWRAAEPVVMAANNQPVDLLSGPAAYGAGRATRAFLNSPDALEATWRAGQEVLRGVSNITPEIAKQHLPQDQRYLLHYLTGKGTPLKFAPEGIDTRDIVANLVHDEPSWVQERRAYAENSRQDLRRAAAAIRRTHGGSNDERQIMLSSLRARIRALDTELADFNAEHNLLAELRRSMEAGSPRNPNFDAAYDPSATNAAYRLLQHGVFDPKARYIGGSNLSPADMTAVNNTFIRPTPAGTKVLDDYRFYRSDAPREFTQHDSNKPYEALTTGELLVQAIKDLNALSAPRVGKPSSLPARLQLVLQKAAGRDVLANTGTPFYVYSDPITPHTPLRDPLIGRLAKWYEGRFRR